MRLQPFAIATAVKLKSSNMQPVENSWSISPWYSPGSFPLCEGFRWLDLQPSDLGCAERSLSLSGAADSLGSAGDVTVFERHMPEPAHTITELVFVRLNSPCALLALVHVKSLLSTWSSFLQSRCCRDCNRRVWDGLLCFCFGPVTSSSPSSEYLHHVSLYYLKRLHDPVGTCMIKYRI